LTRSGDKLDAERVFEKILVEPGEFRFELNAVAVAVLEMAVESFSRCGRTAASWLEFWPLIASCKSPGTRAQHPSFIIRRFHIGQIACDCLMPKHCGIEELLGAT